MYLHKLTAYLIAIVLIGSISCSTKCGCKKSLDLCYKRKAGSITINLLPKEQNGFTDDEIKLLREVRYNNGNWETLAVYSRTRTLAWSDVYDLPAESLTQYYIVPGSTFSYKVVLQFTGNKRNAYEVDCCDDIEFSLSDITLYQFNTKTGGYEFKKNTGAGVSTIALERYF